MTSANLMREIGQIIEMMLPKDFGFCLMVFPFNRPGISNYISNAERATMIEALKEKIKVLESKSDFPTPEAN